MEHKKHISFWSVLQIGLLLGVLFGFALFQLLAKDQEYSSRENRVLAQKPAITLSSVKKGKFQTQYETYLTDQFPQRNQWIQLQSSAKLLVGEKLVNGVYFGKDHYLLEQYLSDQFDWKQAHKNGNTLKAFLEKHENAFFLMVPTKSSVLAEKLPLFAEESGEAEFADFLKDTLPASQFLDLTSSLAVHDSEYIFYRTDHHWTTLGAWYGYLAWADAKGMTTLKESDFQQQAVSTSFLGTTYAKVHMGGQADTITLYQYRDREFTLDYNMGEFSSTSFYDEEKLKTDDQYAVFFGGNQAIVDIQSKEPENGKTLLLIKDSFGNSMAPFLAGQYDRTIVVDLRSVNIPISDLLKVYPADDILILYNSVQFMEDKNISKLK